MHIRIDATIWAGEETGVAAATRRLVARVLAENLHDHFTLYARAEHTDWFAPHRGRQNVRLVPTERHGGGKRVAWQQLVLPKLLERRALTRKLALLHD